MSENEIESVLSKRNHKLLNIAIICEVVAWIVLVLYVIYSYTSFTKITQYVTTTDINTNAQSMHYVGTGLDSSFFTQAASNPFVIIKIVTEVFIVILKGITGFLVLYGISYGLKMLVETDINYRLNKGEK
jgi:hypothetical protein